MRHVRNLIIGAGPAGLQLAYSLRQVGQDHLILERNEFAGSYFVPYPRHGRLISINKVYTGYPDLESRRRYDWNSLVCDDEELQFTGFTKEYFPAKEVLVEYLGAFAKHYQLKIEYGTAVTRVSKGGDGFVITTAADETMSCDRLFIATGLPYTNDPEIPGVELCEKYDRFSVNPEDYTDQRIFIAGKGNSAFETADALVPTTRKIWVCGKRAVRLAWASHYVGDLRAVNNNYLDTYQLKAQNNILDGELRSVSRDEATGDLVASVWFESRQQELQYPCDRVLLCTGWRADLGIFDEDCAPDRNINGRFPRMTCEWESTNVPNMYFAGTIMQSRDYRKTMSAFIHGFRHNVVALANLLGMKDSEDGSWPEEQAMPSSAAELSEHTIERLSTSAPMLLQPGFLGDVIVPDADGDGFSYRADMPVDYVKERMLSEEGTLYLITLEYGKHDPDANPFTMPRGVGVTEDFYIHPIVRRYDNGELTDRFWLPDDLDNDWRNEPMHRAGLAQWFESHLGGSAKDDSPDQAMFVSPAASAQIG